MLFSRVKERQIRTKECAECTYSVHSIPPWSAAFVIGRTDEAFSAAFALVISLSISSIFPGTQAELGVLNSSIRITIRVALTRTWLHSNELAFHWDHPLKVALKPVTVAAFVTHIKNCSLVLCGKSFSLIYLPCWLFFPVSSPFSLPKIRRGGAPSSLPGPSSICASGNVGFFYWFDGGIDFYKHNLPTQNAHRNVRITKIQRFSFECPPRSNWFCINYATRLADSVKYCATFSSNQKWSQM